MSTNISDVIVSARTLVGDGPTDNLARMENLNNADLGNVINGTNTVFQLKNFPIVPGGEVSFYVDGVALSTGVSVDEATGVVVFTAAPTISAFATYYYFLMPDSTWEECILWALQRANLSTGSPYTDIQNVAEGLLSSIKTYAASAWSNRIAGQTGLWYNQRLQERVEDRENISSKYAKQAEMLSKDGDNQLDNYYKGAGTQFRPAVQIVLHTPKQYTPDR